MAWDTRRSSLQGLPYFPEQCLRLYLPELCLRLSMFARLARRNFHLHISQEFPDFFMRRYVCNMPQISVWFTFTPVIISVREGSSQQCLLMIKDDQISFRRPHTFKRSLQSKFYQIAPRLVIRLQTRQVFIRQLQIYKSWSTCLHCCIFYIRPYHYCTL